MRQLVPTVFICALHSLSSALTAQSPSPARGAVAKVPAAMSAIRQRDLERDLALLGGDALRGREAGTVDEMRASMWLAEEMRRIGLTPFGEDGSWFQWWNMRRTRIATAGSSVRVGNRTYALWTEMAPTNNAATDVTAATVWVDDIADTTIDVRDKVAIMALRPPLPTAIRSTTNTYEVNYTRAAVNAQGVALIRRRAAAVILVADSVAEKGFGGIASTQSRGGYEVIGGVPRFTRIPQPTPGPVGAGAPNNPATQQRPVPVLLARSADLSVLRAGGMAEIHIRADIFETPSVNVIGLVRGTDPKLRDEYVLFSSHQDHDGVRYTVDGDSIWNGADDNGSTSVALLAIARAWVKQPSKRSALFVFHGAEERGLLGSRYHVAHPVVPLEKIVAVLNGDMIGRNHPDTAALLGSQPPHRNSVQLVDVALDANRATARFVIDSIWDRPTHPEGWYFRSDHVPYAERSVPSLFFSTKLHSDYHTPRDEPKNINYPKLTRVTQWMYMTGWIVGNAAARPAVDSGFVLR